MLSKFWDAATGKLADRWAAIGAPAVVFWVGGVLAWAFAGSGWSRLSQVSHWLDGKNAATQVAALLGALVVVAASAIVVQRLTAPVLRLMEGYWPRWLQWLTSRRRRHTIQRRRADDTAWQRLQSEIEHNEPTAEQRADLDRLEHRRRHRPILNSELMPTRVGNILRAAETRPYHRYGLEAVIVWPRLWLVLPGPARQELTTARGSVDASVAAVIWGLGFVAFTPLAWWATPVGIAMAVSAAVWWVPARAEVFADLVEGAYDMYRTVLYQQVRWPLPDNPAGEHQTGIDLTKYLDRGSDKPYPDFTSPST